VDEAIDGSRPRPRLNAVIHRQPNGRRRPDDRLADGPFRGVPFLLKDYSCAEAGEPPPRMRALSRAGRAMPTRLAVCFRAAGLVRWGATRRMALMGTTEPGARPLHNRGMSVGRRADRQVGRRRGGRRDGAGRPHNDIAGSIRIPAAHGSST
jgi:amidase